jgi:hypothetical protein
MALTDYIGIRGLEPEETECFQGIGSNGTGSSQTLLAPTGPSSETPTETGTEGADTLLDAFKTAFLKEKDGTLVSILDARLSDLAYVDTVVDFGPFRVYTKGKMIEYSR